MIALAKKYHPILCTPFGREGYREAAPCAALAPFVRCFWTERQTAFEQLVIPDTCMDIIIDINGSGAFFCALDESSFYSGNGGAELFGIRFYAWTAQMFSRRDFTGSGGGSFAAGEFFDGIDELEAAVRAAATFEERVEIAEKRLSERLDGLRADDNLLNAVNLIIERRGALGIAELCEHTALSARTLERLFARDMGVSPKAFSSLVRYQLLWQEMALQCGFNILDAVEKYGYADQSHLLNDFRKRHLMTPKQALCYAKFSQTLMKS
ncbi:MAG: AraC family transcriptional regulator [Lachnospiraceae bacterium]|nr:AraC family transcriptional regulator [Ruminococcus sp.]MCM1274708.1 AraC family transcriptional regulator [Lachnospiraceae bacterium]